MAEQAWDLISKALDEQLAKANAERATQANGKDQKAGNGQKRKPEADAETATNGTVVKKTKTDENQENQEELSATIEEHESNGKTGSHKVKWTTIGKTILRAQEDKELPLKKFQKKIIAEYLTRVGTPDNDMTVEVLWASCLKKLSKNPKFKIHKERIKIVS